ncbi:helix-turn-helix transcriptional regulator [Wenzhouxiangella sp. XN79A]|uniref:helix-turn-helix domain-containing protein n=1 Tax=Wenzhouxiangella sp. XN79A TaxID=2724193 RepID=UPI00144A71E1|nr:helix-turn-helix transcriptional regulator [Wenzhouxiangella sp. XN79A]NKI35159.1 helix-turn-helix transcriptional regulator [Wenzhouxiangella sp. XN79A]
MTASAGKQVRKKSSKPTINSEDVARQLADVPAFQAGREQRRALIEQGEALRSLRESVLKINQTQAARLVGMDQSELSRLEAGTGARGPSSTTIQRVINAYDHYLETNQLNVRVGLNIQVHRLDTDEVQRSFLAGSE